MWPNIRYRAFDLPEIWYLAKLSINIVVIAIETKIFLFYFQEISWSVWKLFQILEKTLREKFQSKYVGGISGSAIRQKIRTGQSFALYNLKLQE